MNALKKKVIRLYENNQRISYIVLAEILCISASHAQKLIKWVRLYHCKKWWYIRNFGHSKLELLNGKKPSKNDYQAIERLESSRQSRMGKFQYDEKMSVF